MIIRTKLVPITWLGTTEHGFACGYVGVPQEHPLYGLHYDEIHNKYPSLEIHGGLTFSESKEPPYNVTPNFPNEILWWIGFDTAHYQDNSINCDKSYCELELAKLLKQIQEIAS